jgi:hypothetical protein
VRAPCCGSDVCKQHNHPVDEFCSFCRTKEKPVSKTSVSQQLIGWLVQNNYSFAVPLIMERNAFGMVKYGQSLYLEDNTRDTVQDAREEIGDLLQYLYKAKQNGENISEFKDYLPVLKDLLN